MTTLATNNTTTKRARDREGELQVTAVFVRRCAGESFGQLSSHHVAIDILRLGRELGSGIVGRGGEGTEDSRGLGPFHRARGRQIINVSVNIRTKYTRVVDVHAIYYDSLT